MPQVSLTPKPQIMGILNVTPDSFSDGGKFNHVEAAVAHAREMIAEGADIIDVGGESTRPGAEAVAEAEELARVVPVIEALTAMLAAHADDAHTPHRQVRISIDTRSPVVARAALDAGAHIINDVNGARRPGMLELAAERDVPICMMHMQGEPKTMQDNPYYEDCVGEVLAFLHERIEAARAAGVADHNIVLDPGIGFGKRKEDNLDLMAALQRFSDMGFKVLLGTSRKRFMGAICAEKVPAELLGATCATTTLGVLAGIAWFRVHDVKANRQAADVTFALMQQGYRIRA